MPHPPPSPDPEHPAGPVEWEGTRPRPAVFRALGRRDLPASVWVDGSAFALRECLKHDSWCATGLYQADARRIVCKFGRRQPIFGLPARWVGRWLASRERWFLEQLGDLPGVPRVCGPVRAEEGGTALDFAVAREYVAGHPMRRRERVRGHFFERIGELLDDMHRRGIAYVDLDKRENIIVDEEGRPWLVDYQICWRTPGGLWGRLWPVRFASDLLRRSDTYHLEKHRIRLERKRPGAAPRRLRESRPRFVRVYRALVSGPFRWLRRRVLVLSSVRSGKGSPQSEVFPEEAVRDFRVERRQHLARKRASAPPQ